MNITETEAPYIFRVAGKVNDLEDFLSWVEENIEGNSRWHPGDVPAERGSLDYVKSKDTKLLLFFVLNNDIDAMVFKLKWI